MKKIVLGLISLTVILGCSDGDKPGPVDPTANNVEAQKKKTEQMMANIPPEFRAKAEASANQSTGAQGYTGPGKK